MTNEQRLIAAASSAHYTVQFSLTSLDRLQAGDPDKSHEMAKDAVADAKKLVRALEDVQEYYADRADGGAE